MSDTLQSISDALIMYARGGDAAVIPKVTFSIERSPVETPEAGTEWKVHVVLFGIENFNEEGHPNVRFSETFDAEGSYTDAVTGLAAKVIDFLDEKKALRSAEAETCGIALDALKQAVPAAVPQPPSP